jgi:hypothetical protein
MDSGLMPQWLSARLIFLIPKGEAPSEDIRKLTAYKILAKALSLRLQPMLTSLIHTSQTGFIKEQSIFDNTFMYWEMVSTTLKCKQYMAVLLLDFKKAYDKVNWDFLHGTLRHLGFKEIWIKGIAPLYILATSRVLLGGEKRPIFHLTRSVRQGCPLAPFLFLLFAEAMSVFLNAEASGMTPVTTRDDRLQICCAFF